MQIQDLVCAGICAWSQFNVVNDGTNWNVPARGLVTSEDHAEFSLL